MRNFFNKKTSVAGVILAVAVVITLIFGKNDPFTRGVRVIFTPFLSLASEVSEGIASVKAYFIQADVYKAENERLIRENSELKRKEKSAAQYRKENERLLTLLDLSEDMDEFDTVAARVVSFDPNNKFETVFINKGTSSGVAEGSVVINANGIVGKVADVGINWAKVTTILSSRNAIGAVVSRTGEIAVTEGDTKLLDKRLLRLSFVNTASQISVGDNLETSGAAGVYPAGLNIGFVKEISIDENGANFAIVEPGVDFDNLYEVLVIKDK